MEILHHTPQKDNLGRKWPPSFRDLWYCGGEGNAMFYVVVEGRIRTKGWTFKNGCFHSMKGRPWLYSVLTRNGMGLPLEAVGGLKDVLSVEVLYKEYRTWLVSRISAVWARWEYVKSMLPSTS